MDDRGLTSTRPATAIRWTARIAGALFILGFLVFFVPDLIQKGAIPGDRIPMTFALFLAFIGLTMAWKWEGPGGLVALGSLIGYCVLGLQTDVKPGAIIFMAMAYALPAILFLVCWWRARRL